MPIQVSKSEHRKIHVTYILMVDNSVDQNELESSSNNNNH